MAFDIPNWTGKYRIGSKNLIFKDDNCDSRVEFLCARFERYGYVFKTYLTVSALNTDILAPRGAGYERVYYRYTETGSSVPTARINIW